MKKILALVIALSGSAFSFTFGGIYSSPVSLAAITNYLATNYGVFFSNNTMWVYNNLYVSNALTVAGTQTNIGELFQQADIHMKVADIDMGTNDITSLDALVFALSPNIHSEKLTNIIVDEDDALPTAGAVWDFVTNAGNFTALSNLIAAGDLAGSNNVALATNLIRGWESNYDVSTNIKISNATLGNVYSGRVLVSKVGTNYFMEFFLCFDTGSDSDFNLYVSGANFGYTVSNEQGLLVTTANPGIGLMPCLLQSDNGFRLVGAADARWVVNGKLRLASAPTFTGAH